MKRKITLLALAICNLGFSQNTDSGLPVQKSIEIQNKAGEDLGEYCGNSATYTETDNNGNTGIMFDIEATSDLRVSAVSVDLETGFSGKVYVYRKLGTHVGSETSPFNWLLIDSTTVSDNGGYTFIPIEIDFLVSAGDVAALYVRAETGQEVDYKSGTGGGTGFDLVDDGVIKIKEGKGVNGIFGSNNADRQFLGSVHYCTPTTVVCDTATSNLANNNNNNGIFFDVSTGNSSITVNQIFANFNESEIAKSEVRLFTRSGTFVGNEASILGWALLSFDSLIGLEDAPKAVSSGGLSLTIPANSTQGFYIFSDLTNVLYQTGTNVGDVISSDPDITIYTGTGSSDLFTGGTNPGRNFNGVIDYCVNSSTGLNDLNTENVISLYPVPASDFLNVSLSTFENGTIEIFDMYGKMVYSKATDLNEDSIKIDLSVWSNGTYILQHKTSTRTTVERFNKF